MTWESIVKNVSIVGYTLRGGWLVTTGYVVDDAVTNGGETYACIQDHTAAAGDQPGVGVNWEDYWVLIDFVESSAFAYYPNLAGFLHMPAAWTTANIGFLVSSTVDGTYVPLYDIDGNLVIITGPTADNAYMLPESLAGSAFIKLWSNAAGVNEAQGADRIIVLDLK